MNIRTTPSVQLHELMMLAMAEDCTATAAACRAELIRRACLSRPATPANATRDLQTARFAPTALFAGASA